ncbi:MAG: sulfatase-like hydrolase/transferase [Candidatus Manganitrophus sp.]|nr:MAG: sulfatase-like hydrolase/transferase [Candidatus Manganitrophus sp.]
MPRKRGPELDNTLIMVISDNGASAEGGPHGSVNENKFFNNVPDDLKQNLAALNELGGPKYFNHYPWGWTYAGDTPFRRWKRETYRGGVSDPFIVHWPKGVNSARRNPHAVRPRDRHGSDRARMPGR